MGGIGFLCHVWDGCRIQFGLSDLLAGIDSGLAFTSIPGVPKRFLSSWVLGLLGLEGGFSIKSPLAYVMKNFLQNGGANPANPADDRTRGSQ
jgi:hypothetical protein